MITGQSALRRLRLVPLTFLLAAPFLAQSPPSPEENAGRVLCLSFSAERVATLTKIKPLLERLYALPAPDAQAALALRQEVAERVIETSLGIDVVTAELDAEYSQVQGVRDYLLARRDRATDIMRLADLAVGGGLGIVSSAVQATNPTGETGDWIGVAAGGVSTALNLVSRRISRSGRPPLGSVSGIVPNMLGGFLSSSAAPPPGYTEEVWQYLNTTPAGPAGLSWREQLIQEWIKLGRLEPPGSPNERKRLERLTTRLSEQRRYYLEVLTDRAAMLADLRARVALMKRDLHELMVAARRAVTGAAPETPLP